MNSKAEFRKPSNGSANRKYRLRSSVAGSTSSSDGSPQRDRNSSPVQLRKDIAKFDDDDDERKRDNTKDRQSSRRYHRHDDHIRLDRHVDDYDRGYSKSSYHSRQGSRDKNNSNYSRSDKELPSRHYVKDVDTNSRGKSDGLGHRSRDKDSYNWAGSDSRHANIEKKDKGDRSDRYGRMDYRKSSMDYKGDRSPAYEESRDQINDYSSRRENTGRRLKESSSRYSKEVDAVDEKSRRLDAGPDKVQFNRDTKEDLDGMSNKGEEAGVKGDSKVESKLDEPDVEKKREQLQVDLERQYTACLRRQDGRTVGLGLLDYFVRYFRVCVAVIVLWMFVR
ncbi:HIT zinc finger [Striga asiatica]|uniref:HIT zinc finger n=1 Tax=Striga asiatica TaxID=4170 RepID=A0A5A7R6T6_STRAF|nr:HIT zinc finger [Striga asiatica]